jgi:uncharacterized protein (DUF305 family)
LPNKIPSSLLAMALSTVLFSGCASSVGPVGEQHNQMDTETTEGYSSEDIMFAQMMIPHHQQAIDMSLLAQSLAGDDLVKQLAAEIAAEQDPEIEQMKSWLTTAGASEHMGHSMPMSGMVSESEMAELMASSGADFDKLFLELMIAHHNGAIEMAQMIVDSKNAEAKALGNEIVESQTKQITYMESLLLK